VCASYESRFNVRQLVKVFDKAGAPLDVSAGLPNLAEADEIRPTDRATVVLAGDDRRPVLQTLSFGFPPPRAKAGPIINLRSEGRTFANHERGGRCLIPMSGFYEFTGNRYPKTRWVFRDPDEPLLCLAGVWRPGDPGEASAFALLTTEPGPDIAPYHDRGVVVVPSSRWADWLFGAFPADLIVASAPGTLAVHAAPRPPKRPTGGLLD